MTRKVSAARRLSNARTKKASPTPEGERKPAQNRLNGTTSLQNDKPAELNAVKPPAERGALHGKHQSITAERRSAREASSPPHQNKDRFMAEHESEPVQEDDDRTLNDETPADTTIEHSDPAMERSERGSEVAPTPEFIQPPRSFIQQEPERSGNMSAKQALFKLQATVRELRKYDFSYAAIERITQVPRATAHLWASDVQPIPRQGNGEASHPNPDSSRSDAPSSQPMNSEGDFQPRQIPRIPSEVVASRPRVEDNNGYESSASASMDGGQSVSSRPVDVDILRLLFSRQPEWIDVFLSIKAASVAAGYSDPIKFFHEQTWKDREDVDFFRAAVPHEPGDQESLRENFMLIVRQANAYAEAAKKNGLEMRKSVELS